MKRFIALLLWFAGSAYAQTAHLWIDTDGGTCTRNSSPATYNSASACASIQAALAAASNGDTVIMKAGSYGAQTVTATKGSPGVTVQCETPQATTPDSCKIGTSNADITTNGAWYTLQDISYHPGDGRYPNWIARCSNCTFKNWNVNGDFVAIYWLAEQPGDVTNIVWDGGQVFEPGNTSGTRSKSPNGTCADQEDNEVMWVGAYNDSANFFGNGTLSGTIKNVTFRGAYVDAAQTCLGDNLHLERLRIDGRVTLTVEKNVFTNDGNENTGTLFVSSYLGGPPTVTFRNNYIGGQGTAGLQNNTGGTCNFTFNYNTIESQFAYTPGSCESGVTYRYNAISSSTCSGTHTGNYIYGTSCAGDTQKTGASFKAAMGLDTDGYTVLAGSSLIDAAESTCATYANSEDIRSNSRPSGAACDVGAFEYGAGSPTNSFPVSYYKLMSIIGMLGFGSLLGAMFYGARNLGRNWLAAFVRLGEMGRRPSTGLAR